MWSVIVIFFHPLSIVFRFTIFAYLVFVPSLHYRDSTWEFGFASSYHVLWSKTRFLEKFVMKGKNRQSGRMSSIPHASNFQFVFLCPLGLSIDIRKLLDVVTATNDTVSTCIVITLTVLMTAFLYIPHRLALFLIILFAFPFGRSFEGCIATDRKFKGTIFLSKEKMPQMHLSIK